MYSGPCAAIAAVLLLLPAALLAQGRGGRGGPSPPAKAAAPIDLTGYWTAVVTEDYHERMMTAPKGDFGGGAPGTTISLNGTFNGTPTPSAGGNIPYNRAGEQLALQWDPARDEAEGNPCKAYGAAGIMRLPTHLHINWQDDNTLRMDADLGTQSRVFHFVPPSAPGEPAAKIEAPANEPPSGQGFSTAEWSIQGGRGDWARGGSLKVVTTHLKPGYYWKNGMPYSANLVLTEHFRVTNETNGDVWLNLSQMAVDPDYLTQPWIVTYHFKRLPDGSLWKPTPCSVH
jgi:hypothetical protein